MTSTTGGGDVSAHMDDHEFWSADEDEKEEQAPMVVPVSGSRQARQKLYAFTFADAKALPYVLRSYAGLAYVCVAGLLLLAGFIYALRGEAAPSGGSESAPGDGDVQTTTLSMEAAGSPSTTGYYYYYHYSSKSSEGSGNGEQQAGAYYNYYYADTTSEPAGSADTTAQSETAYAYYYSESEGQSTQSPSQSQVESEGGSTYSSNTSSHFGGDDSESPEDLGAENVGLIQNSSSSSSSPSDDGSDVVVAESSGNNGTSNLSFDRNYYSYDAEDTAEEELPPTGQQNASLASGVQSSNQTNVLQTSGNSSELAAGVSEEGSSSGMNSSSVEPETESVGDILRTQVAAERVVAAGLATGVLNLSIPLPEASQQSGSDTSGTLLVSSETGNLEAGRIRMAPQGTLDDLSAATAPAETTQMPALSIEIRVVVPTVEPPQDGSDRPAAVQTLEVKAPFRASSMLQKPAPTAAPQKQESQSTIGAEASATLPAAAPVVTATASLEAATALGAVSTMPATPVATVPATAPTPLAVVTTAAAPVTYPRLRGTLPPP
mmetsp:Transcript_67492/g.161969  ORF Transcript_67492/g.161969 Transcript_67492/m.161969 type:complete len:548 (+) Transcript_67492:83-1726(+)